jgi:hypothetical protein
VQVHLPHKLRKQQVGRQRSGTSLLQTTVSETRTSVASASAAARALTGCVAVTAEHWSVSARLEWNCRRLSAPGTDDRSSMRCLRVGAISSASALVTLFRHATGFAAFWCRKTAFLEKLLICCGEGKFLSAVAASKLNIAGHGAPRKDVLRTIPLF